MPELVLLADQLLAPVPGGTGRYTRELGAALAATAPPGWTVRSVVPRCADPTVAAIEGVAGPSVLALPRRALIAAWERRIPLWPGGDSVHAPTPLAPPARHGKGLVVTVHDAVPFTHPETLTPRGARWHRKAIAQAARAADTILVPTAAVGAQLGPRIGGTPLTVVGHGRTAALAQPPGDAAAIAARLRLPPEYLLMIGTVEPRKGVEVLLRALAEPGAPALPLVLAGPRGWGQVEPDRLAAGLGVPAPLELGAVTDAELATVLHRAAALVAPSRSEGFGLPVLEAMAAGVPVVHSNAPALVELADGTGLGFPVGDAHALAAVLRDVFENTAATAARVTAAKARAKAFTWADSAARVWAAHLEAHHVRCPG
ncbi:glycosyltransferase family 4 protein [Sciscionella sediminilitoris]|uniref:glycosyltransferase family 4 protein n=1 Tax=Sciscionella sediminilitoris TaxID=1445613 RepID=UPI0004DF9CE2|nr:glycosyltransferase family 1 protein [Sciscionella sp. SE31]